MYWRPLNLRRLLRKSLEVETSRDFATLEYMLLLGWTKHLSDQYSTLEFWPEPKPKPVQEGFGYDVVAKKAGY